MADEARTSFASLLETGQRLLDELDGILKSSGIRQREELQCSQPADESAPRPKEASRSFSLQDDGTAQPVEEQDARDLALDDGCPPPSEPIASECNAVKEQLPHLTEADALRLAQRKRKTMSACSGGESNPVRYRSKQSIVVYYDGEIQKRLEFVVRTIGICRNSMRKGKMSAKIDSLSRGSSSSGEESLDEDAMNPLKLRCYSSRLRSSRLLPDVDGTQAFDKADGFLDKAQALCERAAHQVLRDGDCATEIHGATENINHALDVGRTELPLLEKKAEKAAEQRKKEEAEAERRKADDKDRGWDSKNDSDGNRSSPSNTILEVDELEADGSDEDGDPCLSILETLRMGKFHVRATTRITRGLQTSRGE